MSLFKRKKKQIKAMVYKKIIPLNKGFIVYDFIKNKREVLFSE